MDGIGLEALPSVAQWLVVAAALCAAYWTIWHKAVRPIASIARKIHGTYEKVMEYDDRIRHVEDRAEQLVNNGGSSLRDAVDRIEVGQVAQATALSEHVEWGRDELLKVWQNLASRDAVEAAQKTAEMITSKEGVKK